MPDFRESRFWDKELERKDSLPDTRLRYTDREMVQVRLGRMEMDVVYCGTCAKPSGLVPVHCAFVYFMCDACFVAGHVPLPGTMQGPDPEGFQPAGAAQAA